MTKTSGPSQKDSAVTLALAAEVHQDGAHQREGSTQMWILLCASSEATKVWLAQMAARRDQLEWCKVLV